MSGEGASIDLNADLGESFGPWEMGDDDALLDVVTSANIACGFHAGDPVRMRQTCERAVEKGVIIGAHVGYRDLVGFGRRFIDMTFEELRDDVLYQLGALDTFARRAGARVRYVKPHGALYNASINNEEQAAAVVSAVLEFDGGLGMLGFPDSALLAAASSSRLPTFVEAFADRAYSSAGPLVSRRLPGAVLVDSEVLAARCLRLIKEGTIETIDGGDLSIRAASICVHGDTAGAAQIATQVRNALRNDGIVVEAFVK